MPNIELLISKVKCLKQEDQFGHDSIYFISNFQEKKHKNKVALEIPVPLSSTFTKITPRLTLSEGEEKIFPAKGSLLFAKKDCEAESFISGSIYCIEDDRNSISKSIYNILTAAVSAGISFLFSATLPSLLGIDYSSSSILLSMLLGGIPIFLLLWVGLRFVHLQYVTKPGFDKDDYLGGRSLHISVNGKKEERIIWEVRGGTEKLPVDNGKYFSGSWDCDYQIELTIRRTP